MQPSASLQQRIGRVYARGGITFIRHALHGQLALGLLVGLVGAVLTLLYAKLSFADLAIITAISWAIYITDGLLARAPIDRGLEPLQRWCDDRTQLNARAAWNAVSDLPFAPLRRRVTYPVLLALLVVWDVVGVRRLGLSATSFLFFFPGSILVWLYWAALRFFVMEQLLRPVLADIGRELPDGGGVAQPRITLARRLLIAVPAITVIAGTVVAGLVGDRTIETIALGAGASTVTALVIAGWLVALLADSIAGPIRDLRDAAERVGGGDLDVRVPVVSVDETGALARSFNGMVEGLRERERIRDAFGTYVDREVADHILREGTSLAGEEVEVTALFLDVRDFTGFADRAPATEVVATLNRLFEAVVPVIHDHGGHVDKFVGDGLLAVFGAPRRQPDHADQAIAAACQIAQTVQRELDGELAVGIGVNSGSVVAGNVGGAGRLEFSVIGDAVNVAARVESATRETGDTVLISESTRERTRAERFSFQPRTGLQLKGKTGSVTLYAPAARASAGAAGQTRS